MLPDLSDNNLEEGTFKKKRQKQYKKTKSP